MQQRQVRGLLETKLGEKSAAAYIRDLMAKKQIRVHPKVLRVVGEKLGQILRRPPSVMDTMRQTPLTDVEMQRLEINLWDIRQETLAEMDGKPLRVGEFIAALNYVPYAAVHRSLKTALDFVLRDFALTEEAKSMHLEKTKDVRLKSRLFEEYLLQFALRYRLTQDVRLSDAEVHAYYRQHQSTRFGNRPLDEIRDLVARQALEEKRRRVVPDYLRKVKEGLNIQTQPQLIHAYYDGVRAGQPSVTETTANR